MTAHPTNAKHAPAPRTIPARGLPDPPRFDLWPEALRSAELIRGTLVPCGPGLRGVGWPDSPRVRLAALAPWLMHDRIAAYLTAAWIWGAARDPGRPLRVSMPARTRNTQSRSTQVRVQELSLTGADLSHFGPFTVTSPLRTATDLLFDSTPLGVTELVALRLLFPLIDGGAAAVHSQILATRRPHRRRALSRLTLRLTEPSDAVSHRAQAEFMR
ncbi:hypothetical protein [Leucobacter sp. W1038]|uniref:hypothetical protein n=1 Tax=Leucobacter sp. W1038 TaxID=3438281 RepID=UPI003D979CF4